MVPGAEHWAFRPILRPAIPAVKNERWIQTPVDAFILAKLEEKHLSPALPADRPALLRRATYDLIGLPPTPDEIDAFLADESPEALAKVLDRLLAAPAYGERWGRHWLDVVRYADARDLIQLPVESDFREAWRYRDWVVEAHNRDLPYTDFIRHQIAGDLLQPADSEQLDTNALVATGMLAIADFVPGDVDKEQMIADYVNDQIDVVGRAFLGLTLGCARCHDHKFDPITMEDYYALGGMFFSTRLIPSPVPGNTPLVRVPLLPKAEVERITERKKRVTELEKQTQRLKLETDLEYASRLARLATEQTARYLLASWEYKNRGTASPDRFLTALAKTNQLHAKVLTQWLDYLGLRGYAACASMTRDEDGVAGLHRWSRGTNHPAAIRVNVREEMVERRGVKFPARSIGLSPSKTTGAAISWTSPSSMTVRLSGCVTDATASESKGFAVALDLRTASGRLELVSFNVAPGGSVKLESLPDRHHLARVEVRSGDSLEWVVLPQAAGTPTALVEWTITEMGGDRMWNAPQDLARELEPSEPGNPRVDGYQNPDVWRFLETADVQRPAGEPARWNEALAGWRQALSRSGNGPTDRSIAEAAALEVEKTVAAIQRDRAAQLEASPPAQKSYLQAETLKLQASDAHPAGAGEGRIRFWPNRGHSQVKFASAASEAAGPLKTNVTIAGRRRAVLRFTGKELLEVPLPVPPAGSLFVVYRVADTSASGQRLIGWEDSSGGKHGLGLMPTPGGGLHAIFRKDGANGDVVDGPRTNANFEVVSLVWGSQGTALHRQGDAAGKNTAITAVSSDPEIKALRLGGPGSGSSAQFHGDLAELRVYSQPLNDAARAEVEKELLAAWVDPNGQEPPPPSPIESLFVELCSPRGPYWLEAGEREDLIPSELRQRLARTREELETVRRGIPTHVPQAVVVQDGGPAGTKHEGFKDAHIYLRGNPKKLGKTVPRGFPKVLAGEHQPAITEGSGRLRLAEWIASANNPLTARVAVNRIWQHHFGEGLVRTSTNFGEGGERPTHPELLDYLAARFMESGWSRKAMHRLMMLSAAYQQSSRAPPATLAADPENFLLGRMPRARLDAESLRDSLLLVAGRLNMSRGGPAFPDVAVPRRTLYMMSVRTGTKSGFASVFDAPDCGVVVEKRSVSTVAPQALFFLNDPFASEQASALAKRLIRETSSPEVEAQIRTAYRLIFGRAPTPDEFAIGRDLLADSDQAERLERYCQLLLGANEFIYID
jgi:hypothetical protein